MADRWRNSISFGIPPARYVSRLEPLETIVNDFSNEIASSHIFMITGVRGCGKTVLLTSVTGSLKEDNNWTVIDLNPNRDMLQALAAKLYGIKGAHRLFAEAKLDLSAFGLGVSVKGAPPVTDIEAAISQMAELLKKHRKKILITVDEVTNNANVRVFASTFQSLLRENLPVYLLMTGLYDQIQNLQNEKNLTFLYRAPKINLGPLNLYAVKTEYQNTFDISEETAVKMAKLTRGYSFAFQVLGYLFWKAGGTELAEEEWKKLLLMYDRYLEEYSYDKIWSELNRSDRNVLIKMTQMVQPTAASLRTELDISPQLFYKYRKRLQLKGIITENSSNRIGFVLPRFKEYIIRREMFEEDETDF